MSLPAVGDGAAAPEDVDPYSETGIIDRTYVIEPLKLLHVSVPKNACTSLRWLIAELAGEDPAQFQPGLTALVSTDDAIHLRKRFLHTPRLVDLAPEVRRSITPENGWFVFGVVRDPRSRLFSAWQDKMLMHSPRFRNWRDAEWYPPMPDSAEDIARDFARFVDFIRSNPNHPLARDGHFAGQTGLLRPDVFPYSRIYDVTEIRALLADLTAHLQRQGVERTLSLRRTNDTPLRANEAVLAGPVRGQIEEIYATDFERFGHLWDYGRIEAVGDWPASTIQELRSRVLLQERIGDLLTTAREQRRRANDAERELARAAQRLQQAERRIERLDSELHGARRTPPAGARAAAAGGALARRARRAAGGLKRRLSSARAR